MSACTSSPARASLKLAIASCWQLQPVTNNCKLQDGLLRVSKGTGCTCGNFSQAWRADQSHFERLSKGRGCSGSASYCRIKAGNTVHKCTGTQQLTTVLLQYMACSAVIFVPLTCWVDVTPLLVAVSHDAGPTYVLRLLLSFLSQQMTLTACAPIVLSAVSVLQPVFTVHLSTEHLLLLRTSARSFCLLSCRCVAQQGIVRCSG